SGTPRGVPLPRLTLWKERLVGAYILRRLMFGLVTIWLVTIIVFVGLRVVVPIFYGDVVDIIAGEYAADPAFEEQLREQFGLDAGLVDQYVSWIGDTLRGDMGESLISGRSIAGELKRRVPVSLELGLLGLASAVFLAIPMGAVAALMQDRKPDYVLRIYAIGSNSVPGFWIAILIITFGSLWFRWAPPINYEHFIDDPIAHLKIIAIPALLVGLTPSGGLLRIMRTQMLEVLRQDYIRTARAKGLTERTVVLRHAMRNSLIPIVTLIGLALPGVIAGTALYEAIFVLPGMGLYLVRSTVQLDYPVIQATNLVFAVLIVGANLLVDISYTFLDPRIRYS
ncbi:MAG: ABC transporter permease, partial [Dehalococcoidia bacterium]